MSHLFDAAGALGVLEEAQRMVRHYEVDLYAFYLDLWWEAQFVLDPSLLGPQLGC